MAAISANCLPIWIPLPSRPPGVEVAPSSMETVVLLVYIWVLEWGNDLLVSEAKIPVRNEPTIPPIP